MLCRFNLLFLFATVLGSLLLFDCRKHKHRHGHNKSQEFMHKRSIPELVKRFENPKRDKWQRPGKVIELLELKPGMIIADIGAGSGYFSFRLARAGYKVIALDIDDGFLDHMRGRKQGLASGEKSVGDRVDIRKTPHDSANLKPREVDRIITVNTYHHISDRVNYFASLKPQLKSGGLLYVIDFKEKELPVGPPPGHKIPADTVVKELSEAGFTVTVDRKSLPYQYVFIGRLK